MHDPINAYILRCKVKFANQFRSLPNCLIHDVLISTELEVERGGGIPEGWRWGEDTKAGVFRGEDLGKVDTEDVRQDVFRSLDRAGEGELVNVYRVGLGYDGGKTVGQVLAPTPNNNRLAGILRFRHDDCALALFHDLFRGRTGE